MYCSGLLLFFFYGWLLVLYFEYAAADLREYSVFCIQCFRHRLNITRWQGCQIGILNAKFHKSDFFSIWLAFLLFSGVFYVLKLSAPK